MPPDFSEGTIHTPKDVTGHITIKVIVNSVPNRAGEHLLTARIYMEVLIAHPKHNSVLVYGGVLP
jgi:hypothetical protein